MNFSVATGCQASLDGNTIRWWKILQQTAKGNRAHSQVWIKWISNFQRVMIFIKLRYHDVIMMSSFTIRPNNSEIKPKVKSQYLNLSAKSSKSTPTSVSFTLFLTSDSSTLIGAYQLRNTYTYYYVIFLWPTRNCFKPSYHSAFLPLNSVQFLC